MIKVRLSSTPCDKTIPGTTKTAASITHSIQDLFRMTLHSPPGCLALTNSACHTVMFWEGKRCPRKQEPPCGAISNISEDVPSILRIRSQASSRNIHVVHN